LCFDTTSVNTGRFNRVCVLLENKIGREHLWLLCRHHVIELILAKVFTLCYGPSSSPYIPIFKRFKGVWEGVVRDNFRPLDITYETEVFRESALSFVKAFAATNSHSVIRDDCLELIELTFLVLGSQPATIHCRAPGPIHHALHAGWLSSQRRSSLVF